MYALVPPVSEGRWHEVHMNVTCIPEHVETWYKWQIQWLITWLMMLKTSTKKWQVTPRNGMSCSLQTRRLELYFGQQGYESLRIAYWLFCGLNLEPWAQLSFSDMMCELSCPFSETPPIQTDLFLCTSPPNLIACNLLMTFVWPVQQMHYYLFFSL